MIFLTAPRELGFPPEHCFVIEDASSGVQAAKAGEMATLGVARLNEADADLVVTSLDDLKVNAQCEGRLDWATIR